MLYESVKTRPKIIPATEAHFGVPFLPSVSDLPTILLHMDGTNGSTEFIDSTWQHPSITNTGPATIDTAQSKFGGASGLFFFTYLGLDGSSAFAFGLADLTVDCWVRSTDLTVGPNPIFGTHSSDTFWHMTVTTAGQLQLNLNGTVRLRSAVGALVNSTWYHVMWTRASGISRLFLNGVLQTADATNGATYADNNNYNIRALFPRIGQDTNLTASWNGNIDEFRILAGRAANTNDFTPPTQAYLPR